MSEAYFEVLYLFWSMIITELKRFSILAHGYHWLPLATIHLVGDNREFDVLGIS